MTEIGERLGLPYIPQLRNPNETIQVAQPTQEHAKTIVDIATEQMSNIERREIFTSLSDVPLPRGSQEIPYVIGSKFFWTTLGIPTSYLRPSSLFGEAVYDIIKKYFGYDLAKITSDDRPGAHVLTELIGEEIKSRVAEE